MKHGKDFTVHQMWDFKPKHERPDHRYREYLKRGRKKKGVKK